MVATADRGNQRTGGKRQGDSVTLPRGNTAAYTLARLDRDRPELAARVRAKELSPHAAAIEAGFRQRTFAIPDDPQAAAAVLLRRWGANGVRQLIDALKDAL